VPGAATLPSTTPAGPAITPGRQAGGPSRLRRLLVLLPIGLAGVGVIVWHLPTHRYAEHPGGILDLAARIQIAGDNPTTPIDGSYDGLTITLQPLDLGQLVLDHLTGDPSTILSENQIRPPDVSAATYNAVEKAAYVDGGQLAAAVAERALGDRVTVTSNGLEVFQVQPHGAADGVLVAGDLITTVDGHDVTVNGDLVQAIDRAGGSSVAVGVRHADGTTGVVDIVPQVPAGGDRPVLGVVVGPANPQVDLQVPVTIDARNVEGPSAGLMTALTVYDLLSPTDVAAGRVIAGTGTLGLDGTVGDIGGIEAKARAAEAAGADIFLAPRDQADDARAVLGDRIPVVGVDSFDQALAALGAPA
jgi:PDZ domain-containing protein